MASIRPLLAVPPPPTRFTLREWNLNNRVKWRAAEDQQRLAERVICEAQRTAAQTREAAQLRKAEVDKRLAQRANDIAFRKSELERERQEICKEEEGLVTYQERLMDALEALREKALAICQQCIIMRECRLGVELVRDEVDVQLRKEVDTVEGACCLLRRTLERTQEQLRRLRSTRYFVDRDHEDKETSFKIDEECLRLKETSLNLSVYHGYSRLDAGTVTAEEWEEHSDRNISRAAKEVNTTRPLRVYVDALLRQVCDDLRKQSAITNEAFRRRIEETKLAKRRLETEHCETMKRANDMMRNITCLEKAIVEKESFLALAHTRLGKRTQRPNIELTKDEAEAALVTEVKELDASVVQLQTMMAEAQASLRYLLKTQIQLEEEINLKANTLKIDEVDCMTLRESLDYHAY